MQVEGVSAVGKVKRVKEDIKIMAKYEGEAPLCEWINDQKALKVEPWLGERLWHEDLQDGESKEDTHDEDSSDEGEGQQH